MIIQGVGPAKNNSPERIKAPVINFNSRVNPQSPISPQLRIFNQPNSEVNGPLNSLKPLPLNMGINRTKNLTPKPLEKHNFKKRIFLDQNSEPMSPERLLYDEVPSPIKR